MLAAGGVVTIYFIVIPRLILRTATSCHSTCGPKGIVECSISMLAQSRSCITGFSQGMLRITGSLLMIGKHFKWVWRGERRMGRKRFAQPLCTSMPWIHM